MASIGHIAIGLAARRWYERDQAAPSWAPITSMVVWSCLSLLPDADVWAFRMGIPYAAPWGHRGATHSLAFAALMGLTAGLVAYASRLPVLRTALLVGAVVASHGLLDALTDGGLGSALLWPFSNERFFAPWTPLPVAPIGRGFISLEGLRVATTELVVFAIPFLYGLWPKRKPNGAAKHDAV
jgi:inner membrane protein